MLIQFSPPYIDDDVKEEVLSALSSGWITTGPKVKALEQLVADTTKLDNVVCCNSATSGLLLMLHWFGVTKGDEVIIPSYTYAATALAVMHVGATPVMVDAGKDFNLNASLIRSKITERTKVILPVDIGGWPCDYEELKQIVNEERIRRKFRPATKNQEALGRILILSDAAHSIGAMYKGKPAALASDITVFSFHAVKNITTAEGGAICINLPAPFDRESVYRQLKLWTLNGQTKDALAKTNGAGWRYDIVYPGFKMNMPDICAAIGLAQLRKYNDVILPQRKRVFESYLDILSSFHWAELPPHNSDEKKSACHLFALRIKGISEEQRDVMIERISERGVSVNVHFQPLPMLTVFREAGYNIGDYPVAYENYSKEISLPVYPELDDGKIQYVANAVRVAYESVIAVV